MFLIESYSRLWTENWRYIEKKIEYDIHYMFAMLCFTINVKLYVAKGYLHVLQRCDFSRDSRFKNYSHQDVHIRISLKRVIGIIVRYDAFARERFVPRRTVMITRMHILQYIGCRRNCPWNMLRFAFESMNMGCASRRDALAPRKRACTHDAHVSCSVKGTQITYRYRTYD